MPTNRKEHLRFRYGICLNDGCEKCKSKEVQQIPARKDFVCEACQKPLRECPPPKSFWDKYGKLIIAVAAVVAIVIVVLLVKMKSDEAPQKPVNGGIDSLETPAPIDTTAQEVDSLKQGGDSIAAPMETPQTETGEESGGTGKTGGKTTTAPSIRVPFGTYSGPADGMNGTITVTRNYSLSLRNAAHETIELKPGDVITRTQFRNGELYSGYLQSSNGNRSFHR